MALDVVKDFCSHGHTIKHDVYSIIGLSGATWVSIVGQLKSVF